ncbi:MAG: metallophosphoesterase family protein [Planctomycetaceae bacterium]
MRLAFFGGIYNNHIALAAAIDDAHRRGAEKLFCLGDLGAFGPHPDRVFPLLRDAGVTCLQGNYDESIGNDLSDCQCGYTDPRDNYFAQASYDYTYARTSHEHRRWLRELPKQIRFEADGLRFLLCHGSPRKTNEFVWESTTSDHFLDKLSCDYEADVILGTHTGIHWQRGLREGRRFINVGVLGRPENDGRTNVWYTFVRTGSDAINVRESSLTQASGIPSPPAGEGQGGGAEATRGRGEGETRRQNASFSARREPRPPGILTHSMARLDVEIIPLNYDHEQLAHEMRAEKLPEEFVATILTGWWSTCLEVLPSKERRRGKF